MARQIKQKVLASEVKMNKEDEIVAVLCGPKPGMEKDVAADARLELAHGGVAVTLVNGTFTKMTRKNAEWHVAKTNKNDALNPLTLVIKELGEIAEDSEG